MYKKLRKRDERERTDVGTGRDRERHVKTFSRQNSSLEQALRFGSGQEADTEPVL